MLWQTTRFQIDLTRPKVMGILNVTPDSFSDGGRHSTTTAALIHAEKLLRDGADILDIGGESTRPGSPPVPLEEEMARILPVVQEAVRLNVPLSIDTYKSEVMQAVLDLGADIINDVWALRQPGSTHVVAKHPNCGICLMHMHLTPQTMNTTRMTGDVVRQVRLFLQQRVDLLQTLGISKSRIVLDAGIGFGKTVDQNFSLLARQGELGLTDLPWLAGWSRKSALGLVTGLSLQERLIPSITAAVLAVEKGARIVRVHDVDATVVAIQIWQAMQDQVASIPPLPPAPPDSATPATHIYTPAPSPSSNS